MPEDREFFDYCPHDLTPDECTVCGDERMYWAVREQQERINRALEYVVRFGGIDGDHHKAWVIDQVTRALTGCPMETKTSTDVRGKPYSYQAQGKSKEYLKLVTEAKDGEDGPNTYDWSEGSRDNWDEGIPP